MAAKPSGNESTEQIEISNERRLRACFTGHRIITEKERSTLPKIIKDTVTSLYLRGVHDFYAGGAMGFDTLASLCVLELRPKLPEIKLHLILPHTDQDEKWASLPKVAFRYVKESADSVRVLSEFYYSGCMQARNRELVNSAGICIAYYSSHGGGTSYTCSYALKSGLEFINVYDIMKNAANDNDNKNDNDTDTK